MDTWLRKTKRVNSATLRVYSIDGTNNTYAVRRDQHHKVLQLNGPTRDGLDKVSHPLGSFLGRSITAHVNSQVGNQVHIPHFDRKSPEHPWRTILARAEDELVLAIQDGDGLFVVLATGKEDLPGDSNLPLELNRVEWAERLGSTEDGLGPDAEEFLEDHEPNLSGETAEIILLPRRLFAVCADDQLGYMAIKKRSSVINRSET